MDQPTALALVVAAGLGIAAAVFILRRLRKDAEDASKESPFATSTEGEKRCPSCGMGNLVTEVTCSACGARLPG